MGFGVGLAALGTTEATQSVAVRAKPLAEKFASRAGHRGGCCFVVCHCHNGSIICLGGQAVNQKVVIVAKKVELAT